MKRVLTYIGFFALVFSFMVFFGHKEKLAATEMAKVEQFEARLQNNAPIALASSEETPVEVTPTEEPVHFPTTDEVIVESSNPVSTLPQAPANGEVLEDSVNVRSGPGLDYPVVRQMYRWDQVTLGESINGWVEIFIDGQKFYISQDFVQFK